MYSQEHSYLIKCQINLLDTRIQRWGLVLKKFDEVYFFFSKTYFTRNIEMKECKSDVSQIPSNYIVTYKRLQCLNNCGVIL